MTIAKPALRAMLRGRRDAVDARAIPVPPPLVQRLRHGITVAAYMPLGSEADPWPIVHAAISKGCRIALPHVVDRRNPLRFLTWTVGDPLISGPFGLLQPGRDAPDAAPDIILTPLLGFDRRGNRLGQGAGHYDRAFLAYPAAWRVGIAFSAQEADALVPDPWDVPLHAIATETEWITP